MSASENGKNAQVDDEHMKAVDYLKAVREELGNNRQRAAYSIIEKAVFQFPDDPIFLSYLGYFQSLEDRQFRTGIDTCRRALEMFQPAKVRIAESVYPILYLNLGKAYLAAGMKKEAYEAFHKGTVYDPGYFELKKELRLLGFRKAPQVPFLSRSNFINKYLGLLLRFSRKSGKKNST